MQEEIEINNLEEKVDNMPNAFQLLYPFNFFTDIFKKGKIDALKILNEGIVISLDLIINNNDDPNLKLDKLFSSILGNNVDKIILFDIDEFIKETDDYVKFLYESQIFENDSLIDFVFWLFQCSSYIPKKNDKNENNEETGISGKIYKIENKKLEKINKKQIRYFISTCSNLIKDEYISILNEKHNQTYHIYMNKDLNNGINKKRNPIVKSLRHEVFKRDNYTCIECNRNKDKDGVILHCDHIIPVSQGGTDELSNLQTLCEECNLSKSNRCWKI